MRAKEFIEMHQSTIENLDDVKRIISELMPLRLNKQATDDYYNKVLSADIRLQNYLLQKDFYEKNNAMQVDKPDLITYENEIPIEKVDSIRNSLFEIIKNDKSFGYLYFILGTEQNSKHKSEPIDCIPNEEHIRNAIFKDRDDYPKVIFDDYLDDNFNYQHYENLINSGLYKDDSMVFINHYNSAYQIYDEIRCIKNKIFQVRTYCQDFPFQDEQEKYFELSFVIEMIDTFESGDSNLERCKNEIQKIILPLKEKYDPQEKEFNEIVSNIFLNKTRGYKLNYIRVINTLYELGYFKTESQNKLTKKEVFNLLGKAVNLDLSDYDKDLSRSLSDSTSLDKHLKIFQEMQEKMTEIFNSK